MKRELILLSSAALALSGCGGGGGGTASSTTNGYGEVLSSLVTGYALPSELSAVPTSSTPTASLTARLRALMSAVALNNLAADSDYNKVATRKYVEEHSLEQFSIIEQVLNAVSSTHYADQGNINAGPYAAMVAWTDEQNGVEVKTLEPWVIDSSMVVINGRNVNRVRAWIEEPGDQGIKLIKAQFDIYSAANVNADGSYQDYGTWELNVSFGASGDFFVAKSDVANGMTTLQLHERHTDNMGGNTPIPAETKGILVRAATTGYGQIQHPDYQAYESACRSGACPTTLTSTQAKYAYNTNYAGVQDATNPAEYKDRNLNNAVEMTHRYGLFYADTAGTDANGNAITAGDSVERHKSFGFPVRYTDANGVTRHAYYGAWQGRHSLWSNGGTIPATTVVTREDRNPSAPAETYTVSAPLSGTLTKRILVPATLADIQGIPFETFVNKHFDLRWNAAGAGQWEYCSGFMDWMVQGGPACKDMNGNVISLGVYSDFNALKDSASDRKNVHINRWIQGVGPRQYVYLGADPAINGFTFAGAGFYEGTDNMGTVTANVPAVKYTPAANDNLFVDIGGSIYIEYIANTGWVQKKLLNFDQQTWTPTFDTSNGADTAFTPELGREYYIHSNGANFVVKRKASTGTASSDYEVMIELQSSANPSTAAAFLPANISYLANPWNSSVHYTLDTTSTSAKYMMLIYATDDPTTQSVDESVTHPVLTTGQWGLQAYNANGQPLDASGTAVAVDANGIPTGASRPVQFNWEYAQGTQTWGRQQFLIDANNNYKILSDPISIAFTVNSKNYTVQYDGWMHGLPDLYQEMSKNNWKMNAAISGKVVNVPAGTLATSTGSDGTQYYIKPLEVSVFLAEVPNTTTGLPSISQADSVSLTTVPDFTPHGMGNKPTGTTVKYSEGKLIN